LHFALAIPTPGKAGCSLAGLLRREWEDHKLQLNWSFA